MAKLDSFITLCIYFSLIELEESIFTTFIILKFYLWTKLGVKLLPQSRAFLATSYIKLLDTKRCFRQVLLSFDGVSFFFLP